MAERKRQVLICAEGVFKLPFVATAPAERDDQRHDGHSRHSGGRGIGAGGRPEQGGGYPDEELHNDKELEQRGKREAEADKVT